MPVNTTHPAYDKNAPDWKIVRDTLAGDRAIREAGTEYLPQPEGRSDADYAAYVKRSYFLPITDKTANGLTATMFKQDPAIELTPKLEYLRDDADGRGTPLDQLAKYGAKETISLGRAGLLVDFPTDPAVKTLADERRLGGMGRLFVYQTEDIINWRFRRVGNEYVLALLVLRERFEKESEKDAFDTKEEEQYRVLELSEPEGGGTERYMVTIWTKEGDGKFVAGETMTPTMSDGQPLDWIPFQFLGADDLTDAIDKSPILDIAMVNLAHYRNIADFEDALFMVGQPTPVVVGLDQDYIDKYGDKLVIGSRTAWPLPKDAGASLLELRGDLKAFVEAIRGKEEQMRSIGAKLLETQRSGVEAAETVRLRQNAESSVIASIAINISTAFDLALGWLAQWAGEAFESVSFDINTDFFTQRLTPQELDSLVKSWQAGAISQRTLYDNLVAGEIVADATEFEDYQEEIDDEGPNVPEVTVPPPDGMGDGGAAGMEDEAA